MAVKKSFFSSPSLVCEWGARSWVPSDMSMVGHSDTRMKSTHNLTPGLNFKLGANSSTVDYRKRQNLIQFGRKWGWNTWFIFYECDRVSPDIFHYTLHLYLVFSLKLHLVLLKPPEIFDWKLPLTITKRYSIDQPEIVIATYTKCHKYSKYSTQSPKEKEKKKKEER